MAPDISLEQYSAYIETLDKNELEYRLLHFDGPLKMDFTKDYLDTLDVCKLRHILMAAAVTAAAKK